MHFRIKAASSIATRNNDMEIRQRRRDASDAMAYVGLNDAQRIHKDGSVISWVFYSIYDGEVALQVWRKVSTKGQKAEWVNFMFFWE